MFFQTLSTIMVCKMCLNILQSGHRNYYDSMCYFEVILCKFLFFVYHWIAVVNLINKTLLLFAMIHIFITFCFCLKFLFFEVRVCRICIFDNQSECWSSMFILPFLLMWMIQLKLKFKYKLHITWEHVGFIWSIWSI